jgi:hypothetical protein
MHDHPEFLRNVAAHDEQPKEPFVPFTNPSFGVHISLEIPEINPPASGRSSTLSAFPMGTNRRPRF